MAEDRFFYPHKAVPQERAVLVGTVLPGDDRDEEEENLLELAQLGRAAGARVLHALVQERDAPDVSTYIGRGKVEELAALCKEREANLIIFDSELSPVQARNLEKRTETNVCDRTELILDIFARRARTRQARLQVELAQLEYLRPRLRRMWEHLSRQEGGIGTRGPGETQLEVDRRRLGDRVIQLKRELEKVARTSETKARQRRRRGFGVALVGYTNVGKSSLLNALYPGLDLRVNAVTGRTGLGRHTTTHTELHPVPGGGFIADSPGLRGFDPWDIAPAGIGAYFPDLEAESARCRFRGCLHRDEPDCGVKDAVARGALPAWRWEGYLALLRDLEDRRKATGYRS